MNESITLVTSIAPRNIENQQCAIESWLRLGFRVTSLNIESEIPKLSPLFKDVEFRHVSRDAQAECGRPLVYLEDMFGFLREEGTAISGIINSDIHLHATRETMNFIVEQARGSMVFACRIDVDALGDQAGEVFWEGFDVFIFDKMILDSLAKTRFCLGQPWWDYWLPFSASYMPGVHLPKILTSPFAVHVKHKVNWSSGNNYQKYGMQCAQHLNPPLYKELLAQSSKQKGNTLSVYAVEVLVNILRRCTWVSHVPEGQGKSVQGL